MSEVYCVTCQLFVCADPFIHYGHRIDESIVRCEHGLRSDRCSECSAKKPTDNGVEGGEHE
jgi:hypothetical protein